MREINAAPRGGETNGSKRVAVLHIPHSSRHVPKEERQAVLLDDAALEQELLRMTDACTDELFPVTPFEAGRVVFPVSRLVCDVERFPSDEDEPMAQRGMGVSYTRTSIGGTLRSPLPRTIRERLLDRWYRPHHAKLERMVSDVVTRFGHCLIIDCHSFPSVALPYELDQSQGRADFCIGTDAFHTPPPVRDAIVGAIKQTGFSVSVDAPFSGALVPLASYRKDQRIRSVMIEVNRRLYMDEVSGRITGDLGRVSAAIAILIASAAKAAYVS